MRREYGVGGHRVEQPGDPPQPLGHGHPPCPGQPEPLPHGLLQFHDAVGDVPDRVGDVQPQRGRAVAGGDESVPLFQEEGLGALLAEPVGEVGGGGAGARWVGVVRPGASSTVSSGNCWSSMPIQSAACVVGSAAADAGLRSGKEPPRGAGTADMIGRRCAGISTGRPER